MNTSHLTEQIRKDLEIRLFSECLSSFEERIGYWCRLGRLWKLIKKRYSDEEFHLQEAATCTGMSANNLNRILHFHCGQTFYELLNRYRILKAIENMQQRDDSVLEIALASGFGSQTSLQRNTKKFLGMRPKDIRELVINRIRRQDD